MCECVCVLCACVMGRGVCVCVCVPIFYRIRIQTVHLILLSTSTLGAPGRETSRGADHSRTPRGRTLAARSLAETPLLWTLACVGTGSRTESEGALVRGRGTGKSTGAASVTGAGWTASSFLAPPHTGMSRLYGAPVFLAPSSRKKNSARPRKPSHPVPPCSHCTPRG